MCVGRNERCGTSGRWTHHSHCVTPSLGTLTIITPIATNRMRAVRDTRWVWLDSSIDSWNGDRLKLPHRGVASALRAFPQYVEMQDTRRCRGHQLVRQSVWMYYRREGFDAINHSRARA